MEKNIKEFCVDETNVGVRLDIFVSSILTDSTRSHIKTLIENKKILVNGKSVKAGFNLKLNDCVTVEESKPISSTMKAEDIKLDIVYEDDDFAVINKPQGMVVHPAVGNYEHTLVNALLFNIKNLSGINGVIRPGIVHRLDKETSGLLVIAKNDSAHVNLSKQIQEKTCKRYYLALVEGTIKPDCGEIINYIGRDKKNRLKKAVVSEKEGKLAHTIYKTVKYYNGYSLVEFELKTGRTHQIRVHSSFMHHPIVGDKLYNNNKCKFALNGQLLHAYKLVLKRPKDNKELTFVVDLPDYFKKVLNSLKEV